MPFLLLIVIVALVAYLLIARSRELFVLRVQRGRLSRVRGNVPPGLMASFRDALDGVGNGKIKVSRTPNGARLTASGLSTSMEQRLSNILGLYPASKLYAPSIDKRKTARDVVTVAWFLDLFRRR